MDPDDDNVGRRQPRIAARTQAAPRRSGPKRARTGRRQPRYWWPRWQGVARLGLLIGLVAFATVVFSGVEERRAPAATRSIDRADPDAIISTIDCIQLQDVDGQENFALSGGLCSIYDDGAMRIVNGVTLVVAKRLDREGLEVTGTEAFVTGDRTEVTFTGDVHLTVTDGLVVHTDTLIYSRAQGLARMHDDAGLTTLTRVGMEAEGRDVVFVNDRAIVTLDGAATVRLTGDDDREAVVIRSAHATLADADRYMRFEGAAEVLTGPMVLESESATAYFGEEETALERLLLQGGARLHANEPAAGGLREMGASEMTLVFEATTRVFERATLAGASIIELAGFDGGQGAVISAAVLEVTLADGTDVTTLEARDGVRLQLPVTPDGTRQEIRAGRMVPTGAPGAAMTSVRFQENVTYQERRTVTSTADAVSRNITAESLDAGVEEGLSALLQATFLGHVRFEDDTHTGAADEVVYDVTAGLVTLGAVGDAGTAPSMTVGTFRIDAPTIELVLDASTLTASGGVTSVLTPTDGDDETAGSGAGTLPALLDEDEDTPMNADSLQYDHGTGQLTLTGQAHLWQGLTSFAGDTVTLDDQTASLTASGHVRTSLQLEQLNETTGLREVSTTDVVADTFVYDDAANQAAYTKALLTSDDTKLKADTTDMFLGADSRTLERLEATGNVKLDLDGRWTTGDHLVYYDADGRYDMEGAPVVYEAEVEPEDSATTTPVRPGAPPPPPSCQRSTGRILTFDRSSDTVAVDGEGVLRAQTTRVRCTPLVF